MLSLILDQYLQILEVKNGLETKHGTDINIYTFTQRYACIPSPPNRSDTNGKKKVRFILVVLAQQWDLKQQYRVCIYDEINNNNNNNNNNNIYTGGVLTLSGFRNGPVKNIIKKKKLKSYIRKYCIILKKYDIKNSKN